MPNYALQIAIQPTSGNSADVITNSWSCQATDVSNAELFKDAVVEFYRDITAFYPALFGQTGHVWKLYDRADPSPRYPVSEGTWSFSSAPTGNPAPTEVCVCLSFQGDRQSGIPQARHRGRVYIGPLDVALVDSSGQFSSTNRTTLATAGNDLLTASNAATNWVWAVWSTVNGDIVPVTNGWVDNEFDTQRRRGRDSTARTTFP